MVMGAEAKRRPAPGAAAPGARPWHGYGLGLRTEHFQAVLEQRPAVDWFEIISENFMVAGGKPRYYLESIRDLYPLAMHGVSLSIGSSDPLDRDYLRSLKQLASEVDPIWISDHLCWTGFGGINSHDLLPLPYTEQAIAHVTSRIGEVQEFLGREILIENVSSYVNFADAEMDEATFLGEIARRSGCRILLDVNNVYVSAQNHGYDADAYIAALPIALIQEIHLAGHTAVDDDDGRLLIDTHDAPVADPVWDLYRRTIARTGPLPTLIEWDSQLPALDRLVAEARHADAIAGVPHVRVA